MAKKRSVLSQRLSFLAFPALVSLSLVSCGGSSAVSRTAGISGILSGVIAWVRHDWPAAASVFLDTLSRAGDDADTLVGDYALYGLGSTYLSGDERRAAESRFDMIDGDAPAEIVSSVWYQRGIIAYRDGDYDGAARAFKRSLETGPPSSDARVNMELSLRSRDEARSRSSSSPSSAQIQASDDIAADSIFNLVRKKEQDRWKNQETKKAAADTPDY